MATGGYVEDLEDRRDCSFLNDVKDTPELFLAASLQFLHRLLIQRTTRCAQIDLDDALTTREQENSRRRNFDQRQQDLRGVDRTERYGRQLRYMKNLMTVRRVEEIENRTLDRNGSMSIGVTNINGEKRSSDPRVFETKKSSDSESCYYVVTPTSSFDTASDQLPNGEGNGSEVESEIGSYVNRGTSSDIPKQRPVNVRLEPENIVRQSVKTVTLLVKVPSAICHILSRKNSKQSTKVPNIDDHVVETQTYQEKKKKKKKKKRRLTSLFLNLLKGRRTPSSMSVYSTEGKPTSSRSFSTEVTDKISENVLTTVRNDSSNDGSRDTLIYMLKNNSKYNRETMNEQHPHVELFCKTENNNKPNGRSANREECGSVDTRENLTVNPTSRVTNCETKPWNEKAVINFRKKEFANDEALLEPEVEYDKEEIFENGAWKNCTREKIIPLHFSEGSSRLGKMCNSDISHYDIDMFFNIAPDARMRKTQMRYNRNANNNRVEIPVEIKTTETPLHLRKTRNSYSYYNCDCVSSSRENRVFEEGVINSQTMPANRIQTEKLIRTFYRKLLEVKSKPPKEDSQQPINSEDSPLEVLLRHIAASSPISSSKRPAADSKEDTIVQTSTTTPKRQLSKISVCCSSESLSNSDDELTDSRMNKYSTIDHNERKVHNHALDNEPESNIVSRELNDRQTCYSQANKQNYVPSITNDKMIEDKSKPSSHPPLISYNKKEFEKENSNLKLTTLLVNKFRRNFIPEENREVKFGKRNCRYFEAELAKQVVEKSERTSSEVAGTEKTIICSPVLSEKIHGEHKELADAMMRWWGPQINYSTTPSSQTQISTYSISINNLM